MNFNYSKYRLEKKEERLQRFLEVLPGAASWSILVGMLILSFLRPVIAAAGVIAFDFYWLLRLFYMTLFLLLSYLRLSLEKETDWMLRAQGLEDPSPSTLRRRASLFFYRRQVRALQAQPQQPPSWKEIVHLVILPIVKEGRQIVEPGIEALARQKFPPRQILVVLALEERSDEEVHRDAEEICQAYRDRFLGCLLVIHPDGLPGEARVKGANASYAAKEAAKHLEANKIPTENVVISCFDADTVVSPDYFACLTYHFLISPDRTQASFQPIPVYHNNIWEVPGFARVLDIGSSFMQLVEATNPEKLVTFSSHSMSFKALVDVGYWPVDMISDDSAIFWKAFVHFDGRYRVIPMYITLSMDVAAAETWWKTAVNVYKQKRRWAWGVENFPILMRAFLKAERIPPCSRVRHAFKMLEGHITWATGAFLISVIGWLPAIFAGREFSSSVLYYSAPRIRGIIFQLASLSLVTTILLSLCLLPRKKSRHPFLKRIVQAAEWLFVPVIFTFLSALPALDAQSRLMLGRRMEFWVTEKKRG
ncbi:MAG: glycosyltransferase family 2 protein [Candidatus Omnitrophica bacterium]|nr:glycosyltransferase family 2 protein [Candidatus Omnitrophota bacterium]